MLMGEEQKKKELKNDEWLFEHVLIVVNDTAPPSEPPNTELEQAEFPFHLLRAN